MMRTRWWEWVLAILIGLVIPTACIFVAVYNAAIVLRGVLR